MFDQYDNASNMNSDNLECQFILNRMSKNNITK